METVTKSAGVLTVAIFDQVVWVKVVGRATFPSSVDLRKLIDQLWDRGYRHFVFDLCECVIMDSTFLGVLAGIGLKFADANQHGIQSTVEITNPNPRISDTLENLGVAHLFNVIAAVNPEAEKFQPVSRDGEPASRTEVTRTCLEAHKILMNLNPENVSRFKDVTQFLAEDLKKLEAKES